MVNVLAHYTFPIGNFLYTCIAYRNIYQIQTKFSSRLIFVQLNPIQGGGGSGGKNTCAPLFYQIGTSVLSLVYSAFLIPLLVVCLCTIQKHIMMLKLCWVGVGVLHFVLLSFLENQVYHVNMWDVYSFSKKCAPFGQI